jgi:hypothetical protein
VLHVFEILLEISAEEVLDIELKKTEFSVWHCGDLFD